MPSPIQQFALIASIESPAGPNASFHIISQITFNDLTQQATMTIQSYFNQQSYQQSLDPLNTYQFSTISSTDYQTLLNSPNLIQSSYNYIQNTFSPFQISQQTQQIKGP